MNRDLTVPVHLWLAFESRDVHAAAVLLAEDFVADWPLSRERNRGKTAFIALNRDYPGDWRITIQRVVDGGDQVATQGQVATGEQIHYARSFFDLRDGLAWSLERWIGGQSRMTKRLLGGPSFWSG